MDFGGRYVIFAVCLFPNSWFNCRVPGGLLIALGAHWGGRAASCAGQVGRRVPGTFQRSFRVLREQDGRLLLGLAFLLRPARTMLFAYAAELVSDSPWSCVPLASCENNTVQDSAYSSVPFASCENNT